MKQTKHLCRQRKVFFFSKNGNAADNRQNHGNKIVKARLHRHVDDGSKSCPKENQRRDDRHQEQKTLRQPVCRQEEKPMHEGKARTKRPFPQVQHLNGTARPALPLHEKGLNAFRRQSERKPLG